MEQGAMPDAQTQPAIADLFAVGAHFGVARSRRHPTSAGYIFGQKLRVDVFDLEKTKQLLDTAKAYVRSLAEERKKLLFIGGKPESQRVVKQAADRVEMPYSIGRWIGGTFTNFSEISKRVARLTKLSSDREAGLLGKYTKFERLQIDREIERLETMYAGLVPLGETLPSAVFVVDPKREAIAVKEAKQHHMTVIALANSDCDLRDIDFPIPGNDASQKAIAYIVQEIAAAYEEGLRTSRAPTAE